MDDEGWVTPEPPIDLAAEFPELAPYARTTTRLHPRRGAPNVFMSSMGGKPLWPADEAWPMCPGSHFGTYDEEPVAAVPLLQLYQRDVAQLPFPDGTDVLQVLWCPREHPMTESGGPRTTLVWRATSAVADVIAEIPQSVEHCPDYLPTPCVLHPEPGVVEYPAREGDLPEGWDWDRLDDFEDRSGWKAFSTLFTASGTKVGGWPHYCQESYWPDCLACGERMEHLLTVDDSEWDGDGWVRWIPRADERFRVAGTNWELFEDESAAGSPSDISLGGGCMQLFYCPRCPDMPHAQWLDR